MSKISMQFVIDNLAATRHSAYAALSESLRHYSERVAHNAQVLFIKTIEKGLYDDYIDLDMKNAKYIFDIVKYFDVGYAFENSENIYSGKAVPMQHVLVGSEVFFSDVKTREDFKALSKEELLIRRLGKDAAFYHHERWDGHGFPEGLRMEEIPLIARITSICLAFENHTYSNSKRIRATKKEAIEEIVSESGRSFDPLLVDVFKTLEKELVVEGETYSNYVEPEEKVVPKKPINTKAPITTKQLISNPIIHSSKKKLKPMEMIFTPIIDINSEKVMYYQTDLIMNDQYLGEIKPLVYTSVAEKTGQIVEITEIGLIKLLDALKVIVRKEKNFPKVFIKVYENHIKRKYFVETIKAIIESSRISPKRLIFEIPEETFIGASETVLKNIEAIREMGIKIAISEFGIGYSSMTTLSQIDFDIVKIDKKFIKDVATNTKVGGMVRGMLQLIKQLNAIAICEGVDNEKQKETLKKYGCTNIQGKLLGDPISEEDLIGQFYS